MSPTWQSGDHNPKGAHQPTSRPRMNPALARAALAPPRKPAPAPAARPPAAPVRRGPLIHMEPANPAHNKIWGAPARMLVVGRGKHLPAGRVLLPTRRQWANWAGGAALAYGGKKVVDAHVDKRDDNRRKIAVAGGAVGGLGAADLGTNIAGWAGREGIKYHEQLVNAGKISHPLSRKERGRVLDAHKLAHGVAGNTKDAPQAYYRKWPLTLPGGRARRIMGWKNHPPVVAGILGTGALAGAGVGAYRSRPTTVAKARPFVAPNTGQLRTWGLTGAAGLGAAGLAHHERKQKNRPAAAASGAVSGAALTDVGSAVVGWGARESIQRQLGFPKYKRTKATRKIMSAHKAKYGVVEGPGKHPPNAFYRHYPSGMPLARAQRVMGWKNHPPVVAASLAAGAGVGALVGGRPVKKALAPAGKVVTMRAGTVRQTRYPGKITSTSVRGSLMMTGNGGYARGARMPVGKNAGAAASTGNPNRDKKLAQVGLAGNAVAIAGGLHALKVTADQPAARSLLGIAPKAVKAPKVHSAKVAGAIAAGWLGLHGLELTSDAISNRALRMQYNAANGNVAKVARKPLPRKPGKPVLGGGIFLGKGDPAILRRGRAKTLREQRDAEPPISKVATTMSDTEAHRLAGQYDTRGPLPKTLSRPDKMKAYEARYIASGGRKGERWQHRANAAEVGRNVGLATATTSAAALLARRGKRLGPVMARTPGVKHLTEHRLETAALGSGLGGGWSELYGEHARHKRASYQNSPAGVAGSALSRMKAYTPTTKAGARP